MKKPISRFFWVRWYQQYMISQEVRRLERLVQDIQKCKERLSYQVDAKLRDLQIWAAFLKSENADVPPYWFYEKIQRRSGLVSSGFFNPAFSCNYEVYSRYKNLNNPAKIQELRREFKSAQYLHHIFFDETPQMIVGLTLDEELEKLLESYEDMILKEKVDHDFLQERMGNIVSKTENFLWSITDFFEEEIKEAEKKLAEYSQ